MNTSTRLFRILLAASFSFTVHGQHWLTDGLVAYYPLNGNALDVSGSGINGTVVGAVPSTDRFGAARGCYKFGGNGQYIHASATKLPVAARTISLWFYANNVQTFPTLLGYGRGCGSSYNLVVNGAGTGGYMLLTHCSGYNVVAPYTTAPVSKWYHWVVTMDAASSVFYLNGQAIRSRTGITTTSTANTRLSLAVGCSVNGEVPYTDANMGYLNGNLDDVRIYRRALSASEVQQLYSYESRFPDVPTITSQPQSQHVDAGNEGTLSVTADGVPPLSYQWFFNGKAITGATHSAYQIPNCQWGNSGDYSVIVSSISGSVASQTAVLTVHEFPRAAAATANVLNGFIVGATITDRGFGYTNTPAVRFFSGGGSGAQAVSVVSNGAVVAVNVLSAGSGYSGTPVVVIAPPYIPQPALNIDARTRLSFSNLVVGTNYQLQWLKAGLLQNVDSPFRAFDTDYSHWVSGLTGPGSYRLAALPVPEQAYGTVQVVNGFVVGATVTRGGWGYTTNPAVVIRGDGGSNATAVATLNEGKVTDLTITSPGAGYPNGTTTLIAPPPASILWPEVAPLLRLRCFNLSPYDNYQLELAPAVGESSVWSSIKFVPKADTATKDVSPSGDMGFYRLKYVP
jgi:hypothetical protein